MYMYLHLLCMHERFLSLYQIGAQPINFCAGSHPEHNRSVYLSAWLVCLLLPCFSMFVSLVLCATSFDLHLSLWSACITHFHFMCNFSWYFGPYWWNAGIEYCRGFYFILSRNVPLGTNSTTNYIAKGNDPLQTSM